MTIRPAAARLPVSEPTDGGIGCPRPISEVVAAVRAATAVSAGPRERAKPKRATAKVRLKWFVTGTLRFITRPRVSTDASETSGWRRTVSSGRAVSSSSTRPSSEIGWFSSRPPIV